MIPFDTTQITHRENRSRCLPGDPSPTLSDSGHPPAIAGALNMSKERGGWRAGPDEAHAGHLIAHTLKAEGHDVRPLGGGNDGIGRRTEDDPNLVVGPLRSNAYNNSDPTMEIQQLVGGCMVRRLTATECEMLQGFPPGWTCLCGVAPYTTATCRCPDSPRYRALGNAVTVDVIAWIGRRLAALEQP